MAYRAIFSTLINATAINVSAKEVLWDSIPPGHGKQLFFRVAQQNASVFISFYSIKAFDLTTVGMINNSATFAILVLGFLVLNERVTCFSLSTLALSFIGTLLVLTSDDNLRTKADAEF